MKQAQPQGKISNTPKQWRTWTNRITTLGLVVNKVPSSIAINQLHSKSILRSSINNLKKSLKKLITSSKAKWRWKIWKWLRYHIIETHQRGQHVRTRVARELRQRTRTLIARIIVSESWATQRLGLALALVQIYPLMPNQSCRPAVSPLQIVKWQHCWRKFRRKTRFSNHNSWPPFHQSRPLTIVQESQPKIGGLPRTTTNLAMNLYKR